MMLNGKMRYLGLQSLLLSGWVYLACSNLQSIPRMLFCGILGSWKISVFICLGEEGAEYEFSSSHVILACILLCFSYRCPKMRNFI